MATFYLPRGEVRELDRRAIDDFHVPGIILMENAGRGCAELLMRLNPERQPVTILCGPGNNGGDGFVMARHLDNRGWPVAVCLWADLEGQAKPSTEFGDLNPKLTPDARLNFSIWMHSKRQVTVSPQTGAMTASTRQFLVEQLRPDTWIVDALFGTGLTRPLGPPFDELVTMVNSSRNPVLSVDLPSGLDCDTGEPLGPTVRATHVATFVAHKLGFQNPESHKWTGEIHVIDIGAPRVLVEEYRT